MTDAMELEAWRMFACRFGPGDLPSLHEPLLGHRLAVYVEQEDGTMRRWRDYTA